MNWIRGFGLFMVLVMSLSFPSCSDDPAEPSAGDCELVTQGESYMKIVNTCGSQIDMFLEDFAFGALINNDKCEIFGMPEGSWSVEITKRPDGPTRTLGFSVAVGETHAIAVNGDFF